MAAKPESSKGKEKETSGRVFYSSSDAQRFSEELTANLTCSNGKTGPGGTKRTYGLKNRINDSTISSKVRTNDTKMSLKKWINDSMLYLTSSRPCEISP